MAHHVVKPETAVPAADTLDTRVVEAVEVDTDLARVREELRQPGLLAATVPGLRYASWQSPSWIRCELNVPGLRRRHEIRLDSTSSQNFIAWHSETEPEHEARLTLSRKPAGTRLELRLDFHESAGATASQDQLALLMREFLHNLKNRIGGADRTPSRDGRDPLLHTGPRIPPDTMHRAGHSQPRRWPR